MIPEGERKSKKFWYVDDEQLDIKEVIGYEVPDSEYWWCPSERYSLCWGVHLFDTKHEAASKLIAICKHKRERCQDAINRWINEI